MLPCAGAALGAGCAGFGALLVLSALELAEPPDPLDGELEDAAAGFGALELPELEPLSEDDFAAAGFGAGELPPEPPPGLGAGPAVNHGWVVEFACVEAGSVET